MTPRIPRGWTRATERGSGVWGAGVGGGWRAALGGGAPLLPDRTYIRRTDPTVSTDPNHALRLEDEAAAPQSAASVGDALRALSDEIAASPFSLADVLSVMQHARNLGGRGSADAAKALAALAAQVAEPDHAPDAEPMVPGMMRLTSGRLFPLGSFRVEPRATGESEVALLGSGGAASRSWIDDRTPAEFAAAYTAAWEYTERRRAEIAEEVRRAGGPPAPDLGEWPGKPDVPPDSIRTVEVLTSHGRCNGFYGGGKDWWYIRTVGGPWAPVAAGEVRAWREEGHALAVVDKNGRVTGVRRG